MTKKYKFAAAALAVIILTPCLFIATLALRIARHRKGFEKVETGQSRQTVIELMGVASEIRSCDFPVDNGHEKNTKNCFEIFVYKGLFEKWAVAFDKDGKVIEQYYWFLGEYGNRPPDSLN
jgi:hypothetical protein